ncbi:hypothetical protein [Dokdonella sp.]|uniref:hypothetical protein n=1 Tax=Dokdonella sp. TaxID=2291710 RepID=UPI002D7F0EFE|nr:hypothetical protein [Dokdonella sp.]
MLPAAARAQQEASPARPAKAASAVATQLTARCAGTCAPLELYQGGIAERTFLVGNGGDSPIRIAEVVPSGGTGSARFEPSALAPGMEARVTLRQPVGEALGLQQISFDVISPDTGPQRLRFPVFVQSAYRPERPELDFGYVRRGDAAPRQLTLTSFGADTLDVAGIAHKPHWLSVIVVPRASSDDPQSVQLRAVVLPTAALGELAGRVVIRTNVPEQPTVAIGVRAQVYGEVSAMPPVVSFGAVARGAPAVQEVTLRALDARPLTIARVTQQGEDLTFASISCGAACVRLRMALDTARGRLLPRRDAVVWLEGREDPVAIPYSGLVVGPDTQVRSLGVITGEEDIQVRGDTGGRR